MGHYHRIGEVDDAIAELVESGWTVERGKHLKLWHPMRYRCIVVSLTPSDWRAQRNIIAMIRRATK